jgi:hypothetical protein
MKIIHRIYGEFTKQHQVLLSRLGKEVKVGFDGFEIEENEAFHNLMVHFPEPRFYDSYGTLFETKEIDAAQYLVAEPVWGANGYPMPDNDFGYFESTYGNGNICRSCGIVSKQAAPFALKKEPEWKNRKMFGLHWAFGEVFVPTEVYEEVFRSKGVEGMQVLHWKKKTPIEGVVQLIIPISSVALKMGNHPSEVCSKCGKRKYNPQNRGFLAGFETPTDVEMVKSQEYFGSGASAFRKIIVSQGFRKELMKQGIKMQYYPLK